MTTASTRIARVIVHVACQSGAAREDVLRAAGLGPGHLSDPDACLSCAKMARLSHAAADLADCPHFGLALGQAVHPAAFGTLGHLLMAAPRPREALEALIAHQHRLGDGVGMELQRTLGHTRIRLRTAFGMEGRVPLHSIEARLLFIAGLVRDLASEPQAGPARVRLRHWLRGDAYAHERAFNSAVEFGAEEDAIVFRNEDLDRPVWGAEPGLFEAMRIRVSAKTGSDETDPPIVARLRRHLQSGLGSNSCTLARSAEALALSPRSLQRHLSAYGLTFQDVLDDVRKDVVRDRLAHGETDIAGIGLEIGFSDESAFRKACRRWFGATPTAVRDAVRPCSSSA